jgi:hypothetical protein
VHGSDIPALLSRAPALCCPPPEPQSTRYLAARPAPALPSMLSLSPAVCALSRRHLRALQLAAIHGSHCPCPQIAHASWQPRPAPKLPPRAPSRPPPRALKSRQPLPAVIHCCKSAAINDHLPSTPCLPRAPVREPACPVPPCEPRPAGISKRPRLPKRTRAGATREISGRKHNSTSSSRPPRTSRALAQSSPPAPLPLPTALQLQSRRHRPVSENQRAAGLKLRVASPSAPVRSWAAVAAGRRSTAYLPRLPSVPGNESIPSLCVWIDDDVVAAVLRPVPIPRDLPSPLRSKANLSLNPFLLGSVGSLVVHVEGGQLAVVPTIWGASTLHVFVFQRRFRVCDRGSGVLIGDGGRRSTDNEIIPGGSEEPKPKGMLSI